MATFYNHKTLKLWPTSDPQHTLDMEYNPPRMSPEEQAAEMDPEWKDITLTYSDDRSTCTLTARAGHGANSIQAEMVYTQPVEENEP